MSEERIIGALSYPGTGNRSGSKQELCLDTRTGLGTVHLLLVLKLTSVKTASQDTHPNW